MRFVAGAYISSALIRDREGEIFPFTPSHVELVVPEGYLGAYENQVGDIPPGVRIRPVGYDLGHTLKELIFDVPCADEDAAESYARDKIGEPYDYTALIDYVLPLDLHVPGDKICSAYGVMTLRHGKFFKCPLAVRAHAIDPRDLLLLISAQMPIPAS